MIKYIFLKLNVRDGEIEHTHKILLETKCNNIDFAVAWYAAHFYGENWYNEVPSYHNDRCKLSDVYWFQIHGEVCISVDSYTELSKRHYNLMKIYLG